MTDQQSTQGPRVRHPRTGALRPPAGAGMALDMGVWAAGWLGALKTIVRWMLVAGLEEQLRLLAERLDVSAECLGHDNDRWAIYSRALEHPDEHACLMRLLSEEDDLGLVYAVVVGALEVVDEAQGRAWIDLLPHDDRGFVERRWREIGVLRSSARSAARGPDVDATTINEWSDWLQRRVARSQVTAETLQVLAEHGRTKAVRHAARENLRLRR